MSEAGGPGPVLPVAMSWYWDPLLGELIGWSAVVGDEDMVPWSVGDPDGPAAGGAGGRCTREDR